MKFSTVFSLGALAAVGSSAPVVKPTKTEEISMLHTVVIDDELADSTTTAASIPTALGAGVGYGAAAPTESATDASATVEPTSTQHAQATVPVEASLEQPVSPVIPVRICVNKGKNCLTTFGSEFANVDLSWDNLAEFDLGPDGLLVRLNDLKCVDAVPMDNNTWYDLAYVNCTLPNYLKGAVELRGNGIGGNTTEPTADDRAATLSEPAHEMHTIWFYQEDKQYLCANVNDGLNDIAVVCVYQDEGYAMLGTEDELKSVSKKNREVTMPVVYQESVAEELVNMIKAMTYDGSVFWADAWTTNIETVMKYRMLGAQEEIINMSKDEITGAIFPLWTVINDCRSTCDLYAFCKSFSFQIYERVCKLSSVAPKVNPNAIDKKNPNTVTFVQNSNYNREDFVLPEDIIFETPKKKVRSA